MTWLQLRLQTQADDVETLEELLLGSGAVAVTLEDNADQPLLEPGPGETPLWHKTRLTGLYRADSDMEAVLASFPQAVLADCAARVEILEEKDWEREWMRHYQPMRFGARLWICPSWLEPPEPEAINLLLDPGLAFGTGTHPTTALCLTELDGLSLDHKRMVDFGCGSGILALAALKLGAAEVLAVDNDPQALDASRENAARNGTDPHALLTVLPGDAQISAWSASADIVVANILAGPLMALSDTLLGLLRPGGTLMLSGLLATQADELMRHYAYHITLRSVAEHDDWVCLLGNLDA